MFKKVSKALLALAVVFGVVSVVQSPAQAYLSDCTSTFCVWTDDAYTGSMKPISNTDHTVNSCYNFTSGWTNAGLQSATNRTAHYLLRLYYHAGCASGSFIDIMPLTSDAGFWPSAVYNHALSFRYYNYSY